MKVEDGICSGTIIELVILDNMLDDQWKNCSADD